MANHDDDHHPAGDAVSEEPATTIEDVHQTADRVEESFEVLLERFRTQPIDPLRKVLVAWDTRLAETEAFLLEDNETLAFDAQVLQDTGVGQYVLGQIEESATRLRQVTTRSREAYHEARSILAEREQRGEA